MTRAYIHYMSRGVQGVTNSLFQPIILYRQIDNLRYNIPESMHTYCTYMSNRQS